MAKVSRFSARGLLSEMGYAKWDNFEGVVWRAKQLIQNGIARGSIERCEKVVKIGSGAERSVVDYLLDESALSLLKLMAASFKMNGHHIARNEVAILGMVKKWADLKGISAFSQAVIGPYFVDLLIDSSLVIEFDEPHHNEKRRMSADRARSEFLINGGMEVLRFDLASDVVDIILCIEEKLAGRRLPGNAASNNREAKRKVILKAKDFAGEITMFNARRKMLGGEQAILNEHVASSQAVCRTLHERGIRPDVVLLPEGA